MKIKNKLKFIIILVVVSFFGLSLLSSQATPKQSSATSLIAQTGVSRNATGRDFTSPIEFNAVSDARFTFAILEPAEVLSVSLYELDSNGNRIKELGTVRDVTPEFNLPVNFASQVQPKTLYQISAKACLSGPTSPCSSQSTSFYWILSSAFSVAPVEVMVVPPVAQPYEFIVTAPCQSVPAPEATPGVAVTVPAKEDCVFKWNSDTNNWDVVFPKIESIESQVSVVPPTQAPVQGRARFIGFITNSFERIGNTAAMFVGRIFTLIGLYPRNI